MIADTAKQTVILIVDDNPANLSVLFDFLTDAGFQILVAEDGERAIQIAEYVSPDLILLDVLMPEMDGFETCRRLKSNPQTKEIPIIFLTALSESMNRVKGLEIGAVDYLTKPLQDEEVLARVKLHLNLRNLTRQLQEQNLQLEQEITERKRAEEHLQHQANELSEWKNRYEAVIYASRQIFYDWNSKTNDVIYSGSLNEILNYSPQEMEGGLNRWIELIHPEDRAQFEAEMQRVSATKASSHSEYRICRKDGVYITVEAHGYFFLNSAGNFDRMVGFVTDISERKQREEALRQTTQMLQAIVQASPLAILVLDCNNIVKMWNPAAERMFGWEATEVLEKPLPIVPDNQQDEFLTLHQQILKGETLTQFEVCRQRRDGSLIDINILAAPLRDANDEINGIMAILMDITERKQSEQKIREQAALLNVTTDAIFVWSIDNQILFWNKGAERLYGWQAEEILEQRTIIQLSAEESFAQLLEAQDTILQQGEWQGRLYQLTKEGQKFVVESRWTLMRDEAGNPKSILVVNTDITEKQQLEAQFLRTQRMQSIGTLAGGIAHDLNNLLTPVLFSAQLMLMQPSLPENKKEQLLKTIEASTKRGAALIKQVLCFARGIEGKRTVIQLRHLISEVRHIALETLPKTIQFQMDLNNELWPVLGDATQLHQVLINLCINASDAMPKGGKLKISANNLIVDDNYARFHLDAKVGPYVVISVSDTGIGISPEIMDRIFEPFFTTKEFGKGTGLGLSTVHMIVKSHGGFVDVASTIAEGTQVDVYLPAIQASEPLPEEEQTIPLGNGELILVVDDEASIRETCKTSLEAYNYRVLTANDGIEAIAVYAKYKDEINLSIIDMMMPSMDGAMAIRTLQRINSQAKIVAISGLLSDVQMSHSVEGYIQAFLSKPFTTTELLTTIKQTL